MHIPTKFWFDFHLGYAFHARLTRPHPYHFITLINFAVVNFPDDGTQQDFTEDYLYTLSKQWFQTETEHHL